jgi:hypothetical protein
VRLKKQHQPDREADRHRCEHVLEKLSSSIHGTILGGPCQPRHGCSVSGP